LVYADDMIVARDDEHEKQILKEKLATQFEMKDLEIKVLPWDRSKLTRRKTSLSTKESLFLILKKK